MMASPMRREAAASYYGGRRGPGPVAPSLAGSRAAAPVPTRMSLQDRSSFFSAPAPQAFGPGPVRLVNPGAFGQTPMAASPASPVLRPVRSSLGQATVTEGLIPPVAPVRPRVGPPEDRPRPPRRPRIKYRPGEARAWGRLKRAEAAELSAYLDQAVAEMEAQGIPPGIVAQIKERVDAFLASAPPATAEVALTPEEINMLDATLQDVAEPVETSASWLTWALVGLGVGAVAWFALSD